MLQSINNSFDTNYQPALMFKSSGNFKVPELKPDLKFDDKAKREHLIICRFCNIFITSPEKIIEINGNFSHSFTNPAGINFRIGCFSLADGCLNSGESTNEYTWFPGYEWCCAICSGCSNQLGWFYSSNADSFYGLILNHLMTNL